MTGPLVLCGSGEFTPAMRAVDEALLATLPARARIAIVPTAAGLEDTPGTWVAKGVDHFRSLGAEPYGVMALSRADAQSTTNARAIESADWVYFSGGDPGHLVETLAGSPFWSAVCARWAGGAILAGSSAGAMMLGETTFVPLGRGPDGLPTRMTTRPALGVLPRAIVAPHADAIPEGLLAEWADLRPDGHVFLGIDEDTAIVQDEDGWWVRGPGRVFVLHGAGRATYRAGERVAGLPRGGLP
ncbi:MAG TPA: Type 1 glutamine amidotransferase-like domain-containing protein [Candidatus Limnocylindria bacterium]|nr:Type 1 glutamine amidotransferase-like domain-containing protein [Candidatus Limnocylindria bacterium]